MGVAPSNMERGVRPSNAGREVGSWWAQLWRSGLKLEMSSWSWLLLLLLLLLGPGLAWLMWKLRMSDRMLFSTLAK